MRTWTIHLPGGKFDLLAHASSVQLTIATLVADGWVSAFATPKGKDAPIIAGAAGEWKAKLG